MKKITDSSLWPADLNAVRFVPVDDGFSTGEVAIVDDRDTALGSIAPLGSCNAPLALHGVDPDIRVPADGCWELVLLDDQRDFLEHRVLFGAPADDGERAMSPAVAAWATLTVLWARLPRGQRGPVG